MKKIAVCFFTAAAVLVLAGCGSAENAILSFGLDGAVITAGPVIDPAARTVSVTVEPVDLAGVTPKIGVSDKAEAGGVELADGEAAVCVVTAENGAGEEWKIRVNVEPGIHYCYGDTPVTLKRGLKGEDDAETALLGDGVPMGSFNPSNPGENERNVVGAFSEVSSFSGDIREAAVIHFADVDGRPASVASDGWSIQYQKSEGQINVVLKQGDSSNRLSVLSFGEEGEYITGIFGGAGLYAAGGESIEDGVDVNITEGYFKVLRLRDDTLAR